MPIKIPSMDVAIVGAGILGCSAALHLAQAGATVAVFDGVGVAAGASGRNSGAIEHPYDAAQRSIHERSIRSMRALGVGIAERPRGVLLLHRERPAVAAVADQMRAAHPELDARVVDPDELASLEPAVAAGHWACRLETGFPVPPRLATELYAAEAVGHGARLHSGHPAALLWDGATCTGLIVGERRIAADHVIVAAGAATCAVVDPAGRWTPVVASWGVNVELRVLPTPHHVLLEAGIVGAQSTHGRPVQHAFSLITLGDRSWLGSSFVASEVRPQAWEDRLVDRGRGFVPAIGEAARLSRLACARPRSVDGRPLLGRVAGAMSLSVATGNGGRGISTGADCGRLVAEAVMAGSDAPIEPALRAGRFPLSPAAG